MSNITSFMSAIKRILRWVGMSRPAQWIAGLGHRLSCWQTREMFRETGDPFMCEWADLMEGKGYNDDPRPAHGNGYSSVLQPIPSVAETKGVPVSPNSCEVLA